MSTQRTPDPADPHARIRRRLIWPWIAFWLLLLVGGLQEYRWLGGRLLWQPLVDYGSAALVATFIAVQQMRRARRMDHLLDQPLRWFASMWVWLPVQLVFFVTVMYSLRFVLYALGGAPLRHGPWTEVAIYEGTKFVLFFALLGGVHFGLRSYGALVAERFRVQEQAALARQAQLAQLTQQIQPHFLFNALNTISSLIHTDPDMADRLLTRLATLLRAATDASQRPEQSLDDELRLLAAYADIMVQRFADRVSVSWQIDPDTRAVRVPTLALQPLLENCFQHVVERRTAFTHITVRATRNVPDVGNRLRIEIEDDGNLTSVPDRRGVGLGNLERRLASLYGASANLTMQVRDGHGLIVRVELPCER